MQLVKNYVTKSKKLIFIYLHAELIYMPYEAKADILIKGRFLTDAYSLSKADVPLLMAGEASSPVTKILA